MLKAVDMPRFAAVGLGVALLLAVAVQRLAMQLPEAPTADVAFLSILAPEHMRASEPVAILAGVALPNGTTGYRVRVCGPETCTTVRQGALPGPGDWWGRLAVLELDPGQYEVTLFMLRPWGRFGERTVTSHTWEVKVD